MNLRGKLKKEISLIRETDGTSPKEIGYLRTFPFCPLKDSVSPDPLFPLPFKESPQVKKENDLFKFALNYGKNLFGAEIGALIIKKNGKLKIFSPEPLPEALRDELGNLGEKFNPVKPEVICGSWETLSLPLNLANRRKVIFAFSNPERNWAKEKTCQGFFFSQEVSHFLQNWRLVQKKEKAVSEAVRALWQTVFAKDPNSAEHLKSSKRIGEALEKALGITKSEGKALLYSLMLHDIGKIGVPGRILNKPNPLTEEEWKIVRLHPQIGAKILKPFTTLRKIIPAVLHHHERWDGKGYPDGLKGTQIPFLARIVSLVDAFQAMRSNRPYRKALSLKETIEEVEKGAGIQFDPNIARVFLRLVKRGL